MSIVDVCSTLTFNPLNVEVILFMTIYYLEVVPLLALSTGMVEVTSMLTEVSCCY